jgi:hypothetical protein
MSAENSRVKVVELGSDICIKVEPEMYRFETVEEMVHEIAVSRDKKGWALIGVMTLSIGAMGAGSGLLIDGVTKKDAGEMIGGASMLLTAISLMSNAPRLADDLRLTDKAIVAIQEYLNSRSG